MQLEFENKADIPSGEEASFVEFEQDGKQVFMHKDLADSKKTAYRNQGQFSSLTKEFQTFKSGVEAKQSEADNLAKESAELAATEKKEALEKLMEELKESGETEKLHQVTLQQEIDKNQTLSDSNADWKIKHDGLINSLVEKDNQSLASKIANKYAPAELANSFSKLLMMSNIDNADGESFFTNASGDVKDNDMDKIFELLNQDPEFKHYAKFPDSKGGFVAKGGSDNGGSKTISRQEFEAKTPSEQNSLIKSGVIPTD